MKEKKTKTSKEKIAIPTTNQLEKELQRENYKFKYNKLLKNTLYILLIVVALSVLVGTLILPVFQIYGKSMMPTLNKGDIVVSIKQSKFKNGDIVAFYYNNRILVKRIIATSSQWVNIDETGNVYVNDNLLVESYIEKKSFGESDIEFPYQVPEDSYFVLGDSRENSVDSRNSLIGTIKEDEIIGKIIFKIWPINRIGFTR